ncbi:MAG: D-alanine--D-alanine ligase [Planctomycetes bacterium]|nr:D-alanine--D-alanine ligase [Planctomycetota bacterium]
MLIGLTYDLRSQYLSEGFSEEETAEFDREDTVVAIETALQVLGHRTERIGHARDLVGRLAAGARWDLVFNIAEGMYGFGREAQVPALLDIYNIPYTFSDPVVMGMTLHKGYTKRIIRDVGIPTPDFAVIEHERDLALVDFDPPYFVKPVGEGTGKGVTPKSVVRQRKDLALLCTTLLASYSQPVLVESFLPGREFTVGITGTGEAAQVVGSLEIVLLDKAEAEVYSYINKERCEELVDYRLVSATSDPVVKEAEDLALRAWLALGCRDGGRVDLRCATDGSVQFIEVNPLAGLHPEHSDLPIMSSKAGLPYPELIHRIVASATERIKYPCGMV